MEKPWYRFFKEPYTAEDPYFFDSNSLPWIKVLENNYEVIKNEMLAIIQEQKLKLKPYRFHESSSGKAEWQTVAFISWGFRFHQNLTKCPETIRILNSIPGLVSASLSLLESHSVIPTHRGDTNAIVRSHFGISIPAELPDCGFQCGDVKKSWENGKVLPFCDAQPHSAWNNTNERRYVLIIDVMRPDYQHLESKVCATIICTHLLLAIDQKIKFYNFSPTLLLKLIAAPLIWVIRLLLPIQKKVRIFS